MMSINATPKAGLAEDSLGEAVQRSEQLYDRLLIAPEVELTVVVGPSGASSATFRGQPFWTLSCAVEGWRLGALPVDRRILMIRRRGQREELVAFREQLTPYSVLRIRARLLDEPGSDPQALFEEVLGEEALDAELTSLARELQLPVVYEDVALGSFELDRRLNWFSGSVRWGTSSIGLNLVADEHGQITNSLGGARQLWANQLVWTEKVRDFAASRLLDLKNGSWLDDDEAPLAASDFVRKVSIQSVVVDADGACEFWLDDGALFWGHSIVVRGSLSEGLVDAEIAG
ncbi:hypothetical protein LMG6871_01873 [Ralstonia edaphis]|uniref:DUF2262 domain-containing protein n=1 Tax=Ralstonia edaphi TaxID=3058599 RepID=UPI0028F4F74A|nr:DUF2262 domain-containing protein [Ralstonia sp. LMG 6871]CAJ0716673.1 hypothetical protein LMG6871_01873 [Ralstonia sp. LMG 6871]